VLKEKKIQAEDVYLSLDKLQVFVYNILGLRHPLLSGREGGGEGGREGGREEGGGLKVGRVKGCDLEGQLAKLVKSI